MKIVFLKMADEKGVTTKSIAALKVKYPEYKSSGLGSWVSYSSWEEWLTNDNKVTEVSLIPLWEQWKQGNQGTEFQQSRTRVLSHCSTADKIMLGIHGEPGDNVSGYIEEFGKTKQAVNYQQLAQFLCLFLPVSDEPIKLSLIMCYGARAVNKQLNHEGNLAPNQVKSSFAYRFFKQLIGLHREVIMTARTGAVSFSEMDGRSLVQTEAAVAAQFEYEDLQQDAETIEVAEHYNRMLEQAFLKGGKPAVDEVRKMEKVIEEEYEKGRTDWSSASFEQRIIVNRLVIKDESTRLTGAMNKEKSKYGKFVYRMYDDKALVIRKYPKKVLYYGAL